MHEVIVKRYINPYSTQPEVKRRIVSRLKEIQAFSRKRKRKWRGRVPQEHFQWEELEMALGAKIGGKGIGPRGEIFQHRGILREGEKERGEIKQLDLRENHSLIGNGRRTHETNGGESKGGTFQGKTS